MTGGGRMLRSQSVVRAEQREAGVEMHAASSTGLFKCHFSRMDWLLRASHSISSAAPAGDCWPINIIASWIGCVGRRTRADLASRCVLPSWHQRDVILSPLTRCEINEPPPVCQQKYDVTAHADHVTPVTVMTTDTEMNQKRRERIIAADTWRHDDRLPVTESELQMVACRSARVLLRHRHIRYMYCRQWYCYLRQGGYVSVSVCLFVRLQSGFLKKVVDKFSWNLWKVESLGKKQYFRFWGWSWRKCWCNSEYGSIQIFFRFSSIRNMPDSANFLLF